MLTVSAFETKHVLWNSSARLVPRAFGSGVSEVRNYKKKQQPVGCNVNAGVEKIDFFYKNRKNHDFFDIHHYVHYTSENYKCVEYCVSLLLE